VVGVAAVLLLALVLAVPGWQHEPPAPTERSEVAATLADGEVVVAGGYLADGTSTTGVEAYSPSKRRWRRLAPLPGGVNHAMAAGYRGSLYVVGGYGRQGSPLRSAFVLGDGRWRALPGLPEPRAAAGAAVVGGKLYVVGGVTLAADGGRTLARRMLVFDLARRRWQSSPGPRPREHLAVTAARGRVYALAGRLGGLDTNLAVFQEYRPGAGWRTLPPVPEARGGTAAAVVGGTIVSAGGEAPTGTVASVYGYDLDLRRWRRLPDLPTARHGLGLVAAAGRVYAVAGGTEPGLTTSDANESLSLR
jgi:N-acetylneuraminic acid mutarotase